MAATWTEISQMTIPELAEFSASLESTVAAKPENEKLRPALIESLSAECVQCAIRLTGADVLQFPNLEEDARYERLRQGYCARSGCDARFYRVTCAPHPQVNWPALLSPAQALTDDRKADEFQSEVCAEKNLRRKRALYRAAAAAGLLLIVILLRQIYVGGTIPFIREPEEFQVDRNPALDGR